MKTTILRASLITLIAFINISTNAANRKAESINFRSADKIVLNVSVDGQPVKVDWYVDNYVRYPNRPQDQLINIYIPENATKSSPIMFYVNNGGWIANSYPDRTIVEGTDYNGTLDRVGIALKEGYVVVSYGCRSRADEPKEGHYLGHSPATMTDTKAAIRYLRYNRKAIPSGDVEKIFITGTSGGGALSTVIAASGNSPDYFPSLYEIGAAGVVLEKDGTYSSEPGCGDQVLGVIGYCPITDLGHACAAYEWLYGETRRIMYITGEMNYPGVDENKVMTASQELAEQYAEYIDNLGLKSEDGIEITSANFKEYIAGLMNEEIIKTLAQLSPEQMMKDIEKKSRRGNRTNNGWLVFDEDGSYKYDLDKHLYYVAKYTTLKPAPAFSNKGLFVTHMNEDSLFGSDDIPYCPFNEFSWNNDDKENGVGKDETGITWDEYMKTEDGRELALQIKMTSAIDYLLEGTSDIAPYWYIRHGMDDRDTSFAVEALLFNAVRNNPKVTGSDVGFAWLMPHSGDYDVPEAYSWLKQVLARKM